MTNKYFNECVDDQVKRCLATLKAKGSGYATEDRLNHFKEAAVFMGTTPEMALLGMASKHFISVAKLCREAGSQDSPIEVWDEKIGDAINYLLILSAMIREEDKNGKDRSESAEPSRA